MTWAELTFVPDAAAVRGAEEGWRWMIPDLGRPFLCSMFGDLFVERSDGVWRLDTGSAEFSRLFASREDFDSFLSGQRDEAWQSAVDDWFLPPLVEQLQTAGKRTAAGQCYGMTILPIFEGGAYTVDNAFVVSVAEWLSFTGDFHQQVHDLPEGRQVRIEVID